ncbi:hypothetical protein ACKVMT_06190 [Halobacteriales archaeon Cl-PHB]
MVRLDSGSGGTNSGETADQDSDTGLSDRQRRRRDTIVGSEVNGGGEDSGGQDSVSPPITSVGDRGGTGVDTNVGDRGSEAGDSDLGQTGEGGGLDTVADTAGTGQTQATQPGPDTSGPLSGNQPTGRVITETDTTPDGEQDYGQTGEGGGLDRIGDTVSPTDQYDTETGLPTGADPGTTLGGTPLATEEEGLENGPTDTPITLQAQNLEDEVLGNNPTLREDDIAVVRVGDRLVVRQTEGAYWDRVNTSLSEEPLSRSQFRDVQEYAQRRTEARNEAYQQTVDRFRTKLEEQTGVETSGLDPGEDFVISAEDGQYRASLTPTGKERVTTSKLVQEGEISVDGQSADVPGFGTISTGELTIPITDVSQLEFNEQGELVDVRAPPEQTYGENVDELERKGIPGPAASFLAGSKATVEGTGDLAAETGEIFGDVVVTPTSEVAGDFADLGEQIIEGGTAMRSPGEAGDIGDVVTAAKDIVRGEQDEQGPETVSETATQKLTTGGLNLVRAGIELPQTVATTTEIAGEAGAFAVENPLDESVQAAAGTGEKFAERVIAQSVNNPLKTVGSLGGSAAIFKAANAVGPQTGLAARAAIQPGEELLGYGGYGVTSRVAGTGTAKRLFPNKEPLIFSEEAAIRGVQTTGSLVRRSTGRAGTAASGWRSGVEVPTRKDINEFFEGEGTLPGERTFRELQAEFEGEGSFGLQKRADEFFEGEGTLPGERTFRELQAEFEGESGPSLGESFNQFFEQDTAPTKLPLSTRLRLAFEGEGKLPGEQTVADLRQAFEGEGSFGFQKRADEFFEGEGTLPGEPTFRELQAEFEGEGSFGIQRRVDQFFSPSTKLPGEATATELREAFQGESNTVPANPVVGARARFDQLFEGESGPSLGESFNQFFEQDTTPTKLPLSTRLSLAFEGEGPTFRQQLNDLFEGESTSTGGELERFLFTEPKAKAQLQTGPDVVTETADPLTSQTVVDVEGGEVRGIVEEEIPGQADTGTDLGPFESETDSEPDPTAGSGEEGTTGTNVVNEVETQTESGVAVERVFERTETESEGETRSETEPGVERMPFRTEVATQGQDSSLQFDTGEWARVGTGVNMAEFPDLGSETGNELGQEFDVDTEKDMTVDQPLDLKSETVFDQELDSGLGVESESEQELERFQFEEEEENDPDSQIWGAADEVWGTGVAQGLEDLEKNWEKSGF